MFCAASRTRAGACALGLWLVATGVAAAQDAAPGQEPPPPLVIRAHEDGAKPSPAVPQTPKSQSLAATGNRHRFPTAKTAKKEDPEPEEDTPERRHPIRIALTSGYGLDLDPSVTDVNPFGIAFGVRGGYNIGRVYVGTRFLFFVGESKLLDDGSELSADEWLLGFEGGYGWRAGPLVFRPELGFGLGFSSSEATRRGADPMTRVPVDTSSEDPYVELGVALELDLTERVLFGVEARGTAVLGKATASSDAELFALVTLGTLGVRF